MFGRDYWNGRYGRLFFSPDDDGGSGGGGTGNGNEPDPLDGLTPEQKTALQKRIDTAASAARKDAEKTARTRFETEAETKRRTEDEERQRQKDIEAGKFTEVKTSLETAARTEKERADAIAAENERYAAIVSTVLAERETALNATEDKALKDAYPKDGTPLERLAWLDDPRTKAALNVATESQKIATAQDRFRPIGQTPKPNGPIKPEIKPQQGLVY